MVNNNITILDYTDFFMDNIKLPKDFCQKYITLKNENCIRYFKKISVEENDVNTEVIKINNIIEKDELDKFIRNNLLECNLVIVLRKCNNDNDLKKIKFINEKLEEGNLSFLNMLYTKNKYYKSKDISGKIIISLAKEKEILFRETISIYNAILNLMNNNKKILFSLCKEKNIPILNLNIGDEKNIGEGVLYIIKNFKDIEYLDVLILTLISRKKVSVEDIYYIKDPLEEYMYYNKKIIIQELVQDNYKDNLTINLIGLKQ